MTRDVKESISVDYVLGNANKKKQRLTYDMGSGLSYLEKTTDIHLDLLHNSILRNKKLNQTLFFIKIISKPFQTIR